MHTIAKIRAWQYAQWSKIPPVFPNMGSWLSKSWSALGKQQYRRQQKKRAADFKRVIAQGYFNLSLAPTRAEFDSDDGWSASLYLDIDREEDEADGYLAWGRGVGSDIRGWTYDESRSALENRRPGFYDNAFGY